jgi:predicted metal-binding protein
MRWAGYVTRMGEKRNAYMLLVGKLKERDHEEDLDECGRVILKWMLEKEDEVMYTGFMWLRAETSGGFL